MRGGERNMPLRVPILRLDDIGELAGEDVDGLDHLVTVFHRERAAWKEVVLRINDDEHILWHRFDGHGFTLCSIPAGGRRAFERDARMPQPTFATAPSTALMSA